MKDYLVFDLETQNSFDDVGGRAYPHLLKISVAGVYSYKKDKYFIFMEDELDIFEKMIKESELLIGFNTKYFDNAVLQPYLKDVDLNKIPACDIMEDIANVLGHRLSLDSVAGATLGAKKSGYGLDAIKYWQEGDLESLKNYCLDDVKITKDIFDYGRKFKELYYNEKGSDKRLTVPVYWDEYNISFKNNQNNILQNKEDKDKNTKDVKEELLEKENQENNNYSLF